MKQKDVFLESEGDAWYERNARALQARELPGSDPVLAQIIDLTPRPAAGTRILEIGCGDGTRLAWLREKLGFVCAGIDPSAAAVDVARSRGIDARIAIADALPFAERMFEIVVFGFCLYLCDREDLFRIAPRRTEC